MKTNRGFSLVELMIALGLGLLVIEAILAAFSSVRSASRTSTGVGQVTDSGRFALDFIQQAARSAGFMACNDTARQVSLLSVGPGPDPLRYDVTNRAGGYEAVGTGPGTAVALAALPVVASGNAAAWISSGGGPLAAQLAGQVVAGSDVLVVQSTAVGGPMTSVATIVDGAGDFTVTDGTGFAAGQIAVISDCTKSAVFQIAQVAGTTISHATGGAPGNATGKLLPGFSPGAQVGVLDTIVYFIGVGADGDGALFSMRTGGASVFGSPQELVPDIENLQVLYGIDANGTQSVSQYVTANQVTALGAGGNFNSVISIVVSLLAASGPAAVPLPPAAPTFTLARTRITTPIDTRMRKVFQTTVALRNSTS
jgi:type IV pilus assembly protein PilW